MSAKTPCVVLSGGPLSTTEVLAVARHHASVQIHPDASRKVAESSRLLQEAIADEAPHYGVNTGFGALGRVRIPARDIRQLQLNLIRSHSTGVGSLLPAEIVRATLVVLAASLSRGHSGVRLEVVESLVALLNAGVHPCVPELGSVGASGDLAPLAHIALLLVGEGSAEVDGRPLPGREALAAADLTPLELQAKEGLALLNGTHLMAGRGALLVEDFGQLFEAALVAAAMSVDACRATDSTLDERVHRVRNQPGQQFVARQLKELLADSAIVKSHLENDPRVQDPYSFRCCPAVLGAVWDAFGYVRQGIDAELAAVTDNPLVFGESGRGRIVSGGNFHGMPVALPLDTLSLAIAHLAGISERRIYHMLSGQDPEAELPTFLTPQAGLQSGLMIAQYAAAACCNECAALASPASVINLPTSAGMEDYNSFGPRSAAKAARGLDLARTVVAIELLCAATGLDHHRPLRSGSGIEVSYDRIRARVPVLTADRPPAPDIRAIEELIREGAFRLDSLSLTR